LRASRPLAVVVATALISLGMLASAPMARAANVPVVLEMKDVTFTPNFVRVEPGDVVTLFVFNNETLNIPHGFSLDPYGVHIGTVSDPVNRGENRSGTFTAIAGTFYFYCPIPGHSVNGGTRSGTGMVGTLQVGEAPPPTDPTPVIVGGLVVLLVSLAAIAYASRRASRKPKPPST